VLAFELLTGKRPFQRETSTAEAMAHVSAPIPPASESNPQLPREVDDVLARGLAKEPQHRFASAADFVAALREALERAAGTTRVGALPPVRAERSRSRRPLVLLLLGGLLLAGILAATLFAGGGDDQKQVAPTTAKPAPPKTVKETVTLPRTTVVQTVTTQAAAPTTAPATTTAPAPATTQAEQPASSGSPSQLNDRGFELMRAGRYEEALPLLEQAVAGLNGSGELAEAYAAYNLAFTRFALGNCDGVVDLLNRSEQVQGKRKEISRLRKDAERRCG
jgi:serine/threonine-protein kinase